MYNQFKTLIQKIADVNYASGVLGWDQETYMPPKGAEARARQQATLAGIVHGMATSEEFGILMKKLSTDASLSEREKKNVEIALADYKKRKKYTTDFVETMSRTVSQCFNAWHKAKEENNFASYAPHLEKLFDLKKKECDMLGYDAHPYDAMLDQYEPGTKTADVDALFKDVRAQLVDFVKQIAAAQQNDDSFMYKHYPKNKQWDFGITLLKQMGYDFDAGRQDIAPHPFSVNFNSNDVRVTTRINESDLSEMIWSTIHEGGHALYEQGEPAEEYGLPLGEAISLGIHESQSRLWENNVGRSFAYWEANYPLIQKTFPENLDKLDATAFYKAMNLVKPSLIRTSADELTYHFHIMVRFEIEKGLIEGKLNVKDLPEIWNTRYKEYLGIDVPSDTKGVLQDVHWSHGSVGYFPTYSIGSFYAAQFFAQAKKEISGLENEIRSGNMKPLLLWLREKIHRHGRFYTAPELCQKITGEKLNFKYFMDYAVKKYSGIYNLS